MVAGSHQSGDARPATAGASAVAVAGVLALAIALVVASGCDPGSLGAGGRRRQSGRESGTAAVREREPVTPVRLTASPGAPADNRPERATRAVGEGPRPPVERERPALPAPSGWRGDLAPREAPAQPDFFRPGADEEAAKAVRALVKTGPGVPAVNTGAAGTPGEASPPSLNGSQTPSASDDGNGWTPPAPPQAAVSEGVKPTPVPASAGGQPGAPVALGVAPPPSVAPTPGLGAVTLSGPVEAPGRREVPADAPGGALDLAPVGGVWFNVPARLTLAGDLGGRAVALGFFTPGNLASQALLADLRALHEKHRARGVTVIGVYCHKFPHEQDADHARRAVLRAEAVFPVLYDPHHEVRKAYGIKSTPALVLLGAGKDRQPRVIEGRRPLEIIDRALDALRPADAPAPAPLPERPETIVRRWDELAFPSKVLADPNSDLIYVADTFHHRVIVARPSGRTAKVVDIIGSGRRGWVDGGYRDAAFREPRGLALFGERLFVADTANHLIREVNLRRRVVATVLGTGEPGSDLRGGRAGSNQPINAPWDLARAGKHVYVAMAGLNQVWRFDPAEESRVAAPLAGAGDLAQVDDEAAAASFASPRGLCARGGTLFTADSDASAVRRVEIERGVVDSLFGGGLFFFGDRDGDASRVALQFPCGLDYDYADGTLLVADTFNSKIKRVNPRTGETRTILQGGDQAPFLSEPEGLSWRDGLLHVADTGNHAIKVVKLDTLFWRGLEFDFSSQPPPPGAVESPPREARFATLGEEELRFEIAIVLPQERRLSPAAPLFAEVQVHDPRLAAGGVARVVATRVENPLPLTLKLPRPAGSDRLTLTVRGATCEAGRESLSTPFTARWDISIYVRASAEAGPLRLEYRVPGRREE
ncbi:MAG: redoxin domain-containing protein [Planctomycetes bacterium]|nr:redoxin domain-containing protein [Planctomycetota bacterium]